MPDDVQIWWCWLAMLDLYINSWEIRTGFIVLGLLALTYPQWFPLFYTRRSAIDKQVASLIAQLEELGELLAEAAETNEPPNLELSTAIIQAASDLDALLPHPNWHSLSIWPVLAWLPHVNKVLPALRRRNLREARDAINHVDMAGGLKP